MDNTSALRSLPAFLVCPGLDLHFASGDECLEVQQCIGFFDEAVDAALLQTKLLKEQLFILV